MLQFHRKADSLAYQKYTISFGMRFKVGNKTVFHCASAKIQVNPSPLLIDLKYGDIRWFSNPPTYLDVWIDGQKDRDVPGV